MLTKPLSVKERMAIQRSPMPIQNPEKRRANFNEVSLGYTLELAQKEAQRCIQCKNTPCINGCPVNVPINEFILSLREGKIEEAANIIKTKNNLPAVCGRVCPQESQCENSCTLGKTGKPVAIGRMERFVADWTMHNQKLSQNNRHVMPKSSGKKVAIIGSGPSGLTCAADLAKKGHQVEIFEALDEPGGVLIYGIPEFRLPKEIVYREVENIKKLGVKIHLDAVIGKISSIDELLSQKGFDAIFIGTGAGLPSFMNIPGINALGVYSANEFLTRTNLMKGYRFPEYGTPVHVGKKVAVIGAGNVAMDAARSALRLSSLFSKTCKPEASEVHIVYRRSREEVPARAEEVEHAEEEGIIFDFLTNPVEIVTDENNVASGMKCIRMELGKPDESGRRRPVPVQGSEFIMDVDTIIMALGTRSNPIVFENSEGVERTRWGTIIADPETGRTSKPCVWAGGDIVTGAATVISAMGAGKKAAADMNTFLDQK